MRAPKNARTVIYRAIAALVGWVKRPQHPAEMAMNTAHSATQHPQRHGNDSPPHFSPIATSVLGMPQGENHPHLAHKAETPYPTSVPPFSVPPPTPTVKTNNRGNQTPAQSCR